MQANTDTTRVKTETLSLQCPISGRQILNPVMVPQSDSVYERFCVEENVKRKKDIKLYINISLKCICFQRVLGCLSVYVIAWSLETSGQLRNMRDF